MNYLGTREPELEMSCVCGGVTRSENGINRINLPFNAAVFDVAATNNRAVNCVRRRLRLLFSVHSNKMMGVLGNPLPSADDVRFP